MSSGIFYYKIYKFFFKVKSKKRFNILYKQSPHPLLHPRLIIKNHILSARTIQRYIGTHLLAYIEFIY